MQESMLKEFKFLIDKLNLIYKRPEMYGGCIEHIETVAKHIFHIGQTITDKNWVYESTDLTFQSLQGNSEASSREMSVESNKVRQLKWGVHEQDVRTLILGVYSDIWSQIKHSANSKYTVQWIDYLLTDPPILRSPNEVDLILNVLFRTALQGDYQKFVTIYVNKVLKLRGSASIGLYDWHILNGAISADEVIQENDLEKLKELILKLIQILNEKANIF